MAPNEKESSKKERGIRLFCARVNEFNIVSVGKIDFAVPSVLNFWFLGRLFERVKP